MMLQVSTPPDWMQEVEEAILHPEQFKWSTDLPAGYRPTAFEKQNFTIVNAQLIEKFDRFHTRAIAHSVSKGEHEAAALLNFYVIWKYKLWKAEYKTWESYLEDVTREPWSVSASHIEHKVGAIDDFLERGVTIRNVLMLLGKTPTAATHLLNVPQESLPGGDINKGAETLTALGPDEAGRAVNDWLGKPTYTPLSALHVEESQTLYLEIRRTGSDGREQRFDYQIEQMDREAADWFMARLKVRTQTRVFK